MNRSTMRYNSAGSITEKSDVCAVNGCFSYSGPQPHALSSIAGTYEGVVNPHFYYDGDGNLSCVTTAASCDASAAKTVSWTSFDMVSQVQQGTTSMSLLYDPEHSRIQQTAPEGTTYYLNDPASGAMTERVFPTTGSSVWRSYILADGKIVAERSVKGTAVTMRYFVLDHLGSTVALTNETGALVESDAWDAWGKQRNATTGADDTTCSLPQTDFSNRGFTGHEQMGDGLCLVNMNARIYDPVIGRFMSPDDVIPDLYNGQSYNRYTYVENNPLSYTDPTGHDVNMGYGFTPQPVEIVPVNGSRDRGQPGDNDGILPGPSLSPDPYWPHIEVSHIGPSSALGSKGAHAVSNGLMAVSRSPTGLSAAAFGNDTVSIFGPTGNDGANSGDSATTVTSDSAWSTDLGSKVYIRRTDGTLEERVGGTLAWRDNNPGNLRSAPTEIGHNDSRNGRFAIFDSLQAGIEAQRSLLFGAYYDGKTISDAIYKYAPPDENNTEGYISDIIARTGLKRDTVLNTLNDKQQMDFMSALQAHENLTPGDANVRIYNPP